MGWVDLSWDSSLFGERKVSQKVRRGFILKNMGLRITAESFLPDLTVELLPPYQIWVRPVWYQKGTSTWLFIQYTLFASLWEGIATVISLDNLTSAENYLLVNKEPFNNDLKSPEEAEIPRGPPTSPSRWSSKMHMLDIRMAGMCSASPVRKAAKPFAPEASRLSSWGHFCPISLCREENSHQKII